MITEILEDIALSSLLPSTPYSCWSKLIDCFVKLLTEDPQHLENSSLYGCMNSCNIDYRWTKECTLGFGQNAFGQNVAHQILALVTNITCHDYSAVVDWSLKLTMSCTPVLIHSVGYNWRFYQTNGLIIVL